jgi:hypothetical protein
MSFSFEIKSIDYPRVVGNLRIPFGTLGNCDSKNPEVLT